MVFAGEKIALLYSAYRAHPGAPAAYSSTRPAPRAGKNWRVTWGIIGGPERAYWTPYLHVRVRGSWRPVPGPFGPIYSGAQASRWWELADADLRGADLSDVNLYGIWMRRVDLRCANLARANLNDAVLHECNLRGAALATTYLRGTRYDRRTRWPTGFDPQAHGARLVR